MKNLFSSTLLLTFILILSACQKEKTENPPVSSSNNNLQHFGFTLIDVSWDDPTDTEEKTNYIDEISSFSNIADILVISGDDDIRDRVAIFDAEGVTAMLHLNFLFFEQKQIGGSKSGVIYGLRSDYQDQWDSFVATNDLNGISNKIACLYIGEEPSWNGISESDFKMACDYAKSTTPDIPILNIEAYPDVDNIYTPTSVDWVGFDHYFIPNPRTDQRFQTELGIVKSRMQTHQKMMLVLDSHWMEQLHGSVGIQQEDLKTIAEEYYEIANSDTTIIGMVGYFWPSGFDLEGSVGSRHLPDDVRAEYERIGKLITGK